MNESPIPSGWLLAVVFLLWGLAGALDQPPLDQEPAEVRPIEQAQAFAPPVQPSCCVDGDEPEATPSHFVRCFVIDE